MSEVATKRECRNCHCLYPLGWPACKLCGAPVFHIVRPPALSALRPAVPSGDRLPRGAAVSMEHDLLPPSPGDGHAADEPRAESIGDILSRTFLELFARRKEGR